MKAKYDPKAPRWIKGKVVLTLDGEGKLTRISASGTAGTALLDSLKNGVVPDDIKQSIRAMLLPPSRKKDTCQPR